MAGFRVSNSEEISITNQNGQTTLASSVATDSDQVLVARIQTGERTNVLEVFRQGKGLVCQTIDKSKTVQDVCVVEQSGKVFVVVATVSQTQFQHQRFKSELLFFGATDSVVKKLAQFDLQTEAGETVRSLLRTPNALYVNLSDKQLQRIDLAQMSDLLERQAGNVS